MNKAVRKFWWCGNAEIERCWCTVAWDSVCQPKAFGGLGFRRFVDLNQPLVAKLGWILQTDGNRLWVRALKQKYFSHSDCIHCSPPSHHYGDGKTF